MADNEDKALYVLGTVVSIVFVAFIIFFMIEIIEMLNDHRCYTLPLNEFYQDQKCEKYWNMRD